MSGNRWKGWEADARALGGGQAFSIAPFLWTEGPPIGERSRRAVPVGELWDLHVVELPRQMGQVAAHGAMPWSKR